MVCLPLGCVEFDVRGQNSKILFDLQQRHSSLSLSVSNSTASSFQELPKLMTSTFNENYSRTITKDYFRGCTEWSHYLDLDAHKVTLYYRNRKKYDNGKYITYLKLVGHISCLNEETLTYQMHSLRHLSLTDQWHQVDELSMNLRDRSAAL